MTSRALEAATALARCSFDVVHAWGIDGLRGWSGFGELIASRVVGGVTHSSCRTRGVGRMPRGRELAGVWVVSPLKISSRDPRLGGSRTVGENVKLMKKQSFVT